MTYPFKPDVWIRLITNVICTINILLQSVSTNIIIVIISKGWLDDIGLPQYKSQFDEGRVDGRMLHYMTVVGVK